MKDDEEAFARLGEVMHCAILGLKWENASFYLDDSGERVFGPIHPILGGVAKLRGGDWQVFLSSTENP